MGERREGRKAKAKAKGAVHVGVVEVVGVVEAVIAIVEGSLRQTRTTITIRHGHKGNSNSNSNDHSHDLQPHQLPIMQIRAVVRVGAGMLQVHGDMCITEPCVYTWMLV